MGHISPSLNACFVFDLRVLSENKTLSSGVGAWLSDRVLVQYHTPVLSSRVCGQSFLLPGGLRVPIDEHS